MEPTDIRKVLEAVLFIAEQPVTLKSLEGLFDPPVSREELKTQLDLLAAEYRDRGSALEAREIAGGWQFSTRPEFAMFIRKLFKDRLTYRLSSSAMETLSIVAYKQPITRSEIEEIRGVEVSAVLDTLVERRLVKIAGRKETVGRPLLYGTTPEFLRAFGLKRLEELPSIESLIPPVTVEAPTEEATLQEGAAADGMDTMATASAEEAVSPQPADATPENN